MIRKGNVTIGLQTRFGPDWTGIRCGARTKLGGECQRPAVKKCMTKTSGSGKSREDLDLAIDATIRFFKEKINH